MNAATRPVIVIYGNCQAQFLHLLLTQAPSLAARFEFVIASGLMEPGQDRPGIPPEAARAVLLWEQYDQRIDVEYRDELRTRIPDDCPVLHFPALTMNAFWPFFVKDKRNKPEPGFPWGRYPHGDRLAVEVGQMGLPPGRAFERYMELSRELMPDPQMLVDRERSIYEQRDANSDVAMTDFVFGNLQSTYQFWTRGHLTSPLLGELLSRLLERSSSVIGSLNDADRADLQAVYGRYPGQGDFQAPIHPLVAERLGLTFAGPDRRYNWLGRSWTFEEHMTRYLAFDRDW